MPVVNLQLPKLEDMAGYDADTVYADVPLSAGEVQRYLQDGQAMKDLRDAKALAHFMGRVVATLTVAERNIQLATMRMAEAQLSSKDLPDVHTHPKNMLRYITRDDLFDVADAELKALYAKYKEILTAAGIEI